MRNGNKKLKKTSAEMVSAGKALGGTVSALLIGEGSSAAGAELGKYGADVIYANDTADYNADVVAAAVAQLMKDKGFTVLLAPHTSIGKELGIRVGAILDCGVIYETGHAAKRR